MNFHFKTLGCKVNQYETQSLREAILKLGHTAFENLSADAVIINSCTVTAESDRKTRQMLHKTRKEFPESIIILTGCMVQAFPEKAESLPDADIVIGNRDTSAVINAINKFKNDRIYILNQHKKEDTYSGLTITEFSERTRAFMKIEDGCNQHCSYCIIPKARGFVRSRSLNDIKTEAQALADSGYKEIVLVGINLSAFGLGGENNICDAVDTVCQVESIKRVRLGSLEPDHITDQMLTHLKSQEKFCPQFHLSLQSGCDRTLKRMNRHYDTKFYYDLVTRIRSVFNNAAITTDIMVGFAGESEEEFNASAEFVKKVGFARSHIFAYSRRAGTTAFGLPCQVPNRDKQIRTRKMIEITKDSEREFLSSQIGLRVPVLFEKKKNGINEGYSPNYTKVCVNSEVNLEGKIVDVVIKESKSDYVIGEII
ncbi:MAG: tRNA (N(6)-L-threonylcarbamoyladenosine(37)-C(2))-methylthiotransferase MtaB [Clostridia bacterium]|nr:tRNA (N(6)-L-threonylcarbamoyladenosine(37)-C(2))-methylthiotransferase MtaB [Clostridia bacterium]